MFDYKTIIVIILSIFCLSQVLNADELDDKVRRISHKLRCPTCQAQSVKESEAGLSLNMKLKIRELLQEGKTEAQILSYFEERYGEWILRSPKIRGIGLFLWALPGVIIAVAVFLLFRSMNRRSFTDKKQEAQPLSEKEHQQIENDLRNI